MNGWLQHNGWLLTDIRMEQVSDYGWVGTARYEPCPQPPSDTCHTGSSEAEQKPAPHPHSEDTTGTGHD